MKQSLGIALGLVLLLATVCSGQTINIVFSRIEKGAVHIHGNQAPALAPISWEGLASGTGSNPGGTFDFETTNLPADCVGDLTVGAASAAVTIEGCTPTIVTKVSAAAPRTGQTVVYAPGDDGDLQKGVPWPVPRFTDNGDGTVTDNLTGLIWLKLANCIADMHSSYDTLGIPGDGAVTWQQALDFVAGVNANIFGCGNTGGQTDWRLPNVRELDSLIDYGAPQSSFALPPGHPFTFPYTRYWSSTTSAADPAEAWLVDCNGEAAAENKNFFDGMAVWPVRGGS